MHLQYRKKSKNKTVKLKTRHDKKTNETIHLTHSVCMKTNIRITN